MPRFLRETNGRVATRSEPERWRLKALDKFERDWTDERSKGGTNDD